MYRLLLIDDNKDIQEANARFLADKGYHIDMASTGMDAITKLNTNAYDCILLDVMLPDLNGYAICEAARGKIKTPIIFLSARDSEDDRIKGLLSGGDDYICKPYSLAELGTRVYAQIRRSRMQENGDAQPITNVMVDERRHTVTINGISVILTGREYDVLTLLMEREGEPITAEEIIRRVWDKGADADETAVRVYIQRLRAKLGADGALGGILSEYGRGYRYLPHGGMPT